MGPSRKSIPMHGTLPLQAFGSAAPVLSWSARGAASSGGPDAGAGAGAPALRGPDDDVDVLAQVVEQPEEPLGGEPAELAPHEGRDLRLVQAQQCCSLRLGQPALGDDRADAVGQVRL